MPATPLIDFFDGTSIGGVPCYDQSTEEDFNQFDSVAQRVLACKWSDRGRLIQALNPAGTAIGGVYVLNQAQQYPDFPGMYAQRFRTKMVPASKLKVGPNGMVASDHCLLTVEYRPFRGGDAQGYVEFDLGSNVITMPGSGVWLETDPEGGGDPTDVPLTDCSRGYPVPIIGIVRGRSNVGGLDVSKFASVAAAPINSQPFLGFEAGTVIFDGCRARKQTLSSAGSGVNVSSGGLLDGVWEIECRFQARPAVKWDYLPFRKQVGSAWQFVLEKVRLKNGQGPYLGRSNLNTLFT